MRGAAAAALLAVAATAHADARLPALGASDPAVRRDAIAALARDGAPDDARALVAAYDGAPYALRRAITEALTAMDDRAVAALVIAKRGRAPAARAWAAATLEAMGKERADAQIRTRSEEVLAGILRAFGEARDPDALGVLASFVGSDRAVPRESARAALLAYGEDARATLRQSYGDLTGQPAPAAWDAEQIARALFAATDRLRLREVDALLDRGLARAKGGDLAGATEDLDAVLAQKPDLDRRVEAVAVYVERALAIEGADPLRAKLYLEKARRLAPEGPRVSAIDGELAYLQGRELEARGAPDPEAYRRALSLDPGNAHARAALDGLELAARGRAARLRRWEAIGAGLVALVAGCLLFLGFKPTQRP